LNFVRTPLPLGIVEVNFALLSLNRSLSAAKVVKNLQTNSFPLEKLTNRQEKGRMKSDN
jgi:hypothetical protein